MASRNVVNTTSVSFEQRGRVHLEPEARKTQRKPWIPAFAGMTKVKPRRATEFLGRYNSPSLSLFAHSLPPATAVRQSSIGGNGIASILTKAPFRPNPDHP
jgi:hypothetical protein